jgi:hypothetical protein
MEADPRPAANAVRPSAEIIPLPASNVVRALPRERRIVVFAGGVATGYDTWQALIEDIGGQRIAAAPHRLTVTSRQLEHRRYVLDRRARRRALGRTVAAWTPAAIGLVVLVLFVGSGL